MTKCVFATVLEKETQTADFIPYPSSPTPPLVPGGVYMKMASTDFQTVLDTDDVVNIQVPAAVAGQNDGYPGLAYPFFVTSGTPYDVPSGTRIIMSISQLRVGQGGSCEYRSNTINQEFVASQDYTNMKDWFNSNNVGVL